MGAQNLAVSGSSDPVRVVIDGQYLEIPITPVSGELCTSGVGDFRDAAFMYGLTVMKFDPFEAMEFATQLATIYIQYPDREWKDNMHNHPTELNAMKDVMGASNMALDTPILAV